MYIVLNKHKMFLMSLMHYYNLKYLLNIHITVEFVNTLNLIHNVTDDVLK
jgi:hypothetical protein